MLGNEMGAESRITSKGQTTLPQEVRRVLGVSVGDTVRYEIDGNEVRLVKKHSALDLAGVFHDPARKATSVEEMNRVIDEMRHQRHERGLDRN